MSIEQLIAISNQVISDNEELTVNARFLEVETKFADWIKRRIEEYSFTQGVDFCHVLKFEKMEQGGQRKSVDYFLTIGMAKELSMVEKTAKGKEARLYFIACEKQVRLYFIACEKQLRSNKDCLQQNQALKQELLKANFSTAIVWVSPNVTPQKF